MSSPPISPRLNGVARSKVILAGGFAISAAFLAAWLLVWLIFLQADPGILAIAGAPDETTLPIAVGFQGLDARAASARAETLPIAGLIPRVRAYLNGRVGQTSIVYLASPALESFGESPGLVLAPLDVFRQVIRDDKIDGATLRELLEVFKKARGKRLLILDIGRSQADCDAGAVGDDVVAELKRLAQPPDEALADKFRAWQREWAGFAILCSIDKGQWSWTSDRDGRSVFGHYVVEALRRRDDLGRFLKVVPIQVHRWVADQRQAIQTPIVLGDTSLRFTLPRALPRTAADDDPRQGEPARPIRVRLMDRYIRHAAYERSGLPGLDPIAWRGYRDAWLMAERLFRAGRIGEADTMLTWAVAKEEPFQKPGQRKWPSLTLSEQVAADPDRLEALRRSVGSPTPPAVGAADPESSRSIVPIVENQVFRFDKVYREVLQKAGRSSGNRRRDPLIELALKGRLIAERAATTAPGGHPWIDQLVDAAGADRRKALDILFSESDFKKVEDLLKLARAKSEEALEVANAVRLSNQIAADLRYLGEWAIRTQSLNRDRLGKIASQAGQLAAILQDGDGAIPDLARLRGVDLTKLREDLGRLHKDVLESASAAKDSRNWRQIDAALAVPTLPPDLRSKLVDRSIDPEISVALWTPPPKDTASESDLKGLGRQALGSGVTGQEIGRRGLDALYNANSPEALIDLADPEHKPDSGFNMHQGNLAFLEWCLLTAAGLVDKSVLDPLLHQAESPGGPAVAKAARQARARLLDLCPPPLDFRPKSLTAFERAILAMPRTDPKARAGPKFGIAEARWDQAVLRFADILREDGDEDLAGLFLDGLSEAAAGSEKARRIRRGVEALAESIAIDQADDAPLTLVGGAQQSLTFTVQTPAGYPAGQYAVLLRNREALRIDTPEWLGPIAVEGGSTPRTIAVGRPGSTKTPASRPSIAPVVYYRGRQFDGLETHFDLVAVLPEFHIRFATSKSFIESHRKEMEKYHIAAQAIVDKLKENPDECFLYRGAKISLDAILTYNPAAAVGPRVPRRVFASASYDGKALPVRRVFASASYDGKALPVTVERGKEGVSGIEIGAGQAVRFELGEINTSDRAFATIVGGSTLRFEIRARADDREALKDGKVRCQEIEPSEQFLATARRTAPDEVMVQVHRSIGDPIAQVAGVEVTVGGGQGSLKSIHYTKNRKLNDKIMSDLLQIGQPPRNRAALTHDESAVFVFAVAPDVDLPCTAKIMHTGGQPWPLDVKQGVIKAQVGPRADPAGLAPKPDGPGPDGPKS